MKILETLNEKNFTDFLNSHDNYTYLKKDNLKVTHYSGFDNYTITDISNALRTGKECVKYSINYDDRQGTCDVSNWIRHEFNCDMKKLFNYLDALHWEQTKFGGFEGITHNKFTFYKSTRKAIRVFSPFNFHYVKPLKSAPKKWNLTHVYKAIINGQFKDLRCKGKYTDDYAFDAAYNFMQGNIKRPLEFIRDIIENPSGWWTNADQDTISICCHSFDSNCFIFVLNGAKNKQIA